MRWIYLVLGLTWCLVCYGKEIALSFDDIPTPSTPTFTSPARTKKLIEVLKELQITEVMIFANPCRGENLDQLKAYKSAGHLIANHTCRHPRLDEVGFSAFAKDTEDAELMLTPLMSGQKYFRFPYLNEGKDLKRREDMRRWLKDHAYRNGAVSIDNDDYYFSSILEKAKKAGKPIDQSLLGKMLVDHVLEASELYESLAVKYLGRSPKHVLLLHERDVTVLALKDLVNGFKKRGWKIIPVSEAYQDPLYQESPKSLVANQGIITQLIADKTGEIHSFTGFSKIQPKLDALLK